MQRYSSILIAIAACGGAPKRAAEPAHEIHLAVAKIAPRVDDHKLWIKFEATPRKVMTGEAVLVRAACTKDGGAPMVGSTTWPLDENVIGEPKEIDIPIDTIRNATACQLQFDLVAELFALSGEHVMTACWNAGKVTAGACAPPITESFAQGIAALCEASKGVRWDVKGLDRDPAVTKSVDARVWNEKAKQFYRKLLAAPADKRVPLLKAEATKQGVVDCELATFWAGK